jgi:hypothetical protein
MVLVLRDNSTINTLHLMLYRIIRSTRLPLLSFFAHALHEDTNRRRYDVHSVSSSLSLHLQILDSPTVRY